MSQPKPNQRRVRNVCGMSAPWYNGSNERRARVAIGVRDMVGQSGIAENYREYQISQAAQAGISKITKEGMVQIPIVF